MRKVYLRVEFKIVVNLENGIDLSDFISDMEYEFTSNTEGADIMWEEMINYEVTDSK